MKSLNSGRKAVFCATFSALVFLMFVPKATRARDSQGQDEDRVRRPDLTFTVYAALDLNTLVPKGVAGNRGDSLVVDGNLYTNGDGMEGANAGNDPNAAGAIGKIRCRATFIDADPTHPFATFVSELYSWPGDISNLLADGFGPNLGFTAHRIVSGGTGRFRNMVGEIEETDIGFNNTGGCNLRVIFKLRKVEAEHHDR
jgi:hypothetical protein